MHDLRMNELRLDELRSSELFTGADIPHLRVILPNYWSSTMQNVKRDQAQQKTSQVLCEMSGFCPRVGGLRPQKRIG